VFTRGDARQPVGQKSEVQVGAGVAPHAEPLRKRTLVQEDHHRHHPLRVQQLGQIQAVMREPVNGEPAGLGLLLEHEQDRLAPAVRPFHQQRNIQFPEALAEALLQLLLPDWGHPGVGVDRLRLCGCKQRNRLAGIVENQVLEALVVRHALGPSVRGGMRPR
jgi:hypothetical protein